MPLRHAKPLTGSALGAAVLALSLVAAAPASAVDDSITIPDPALKTCLNHMLGQDPDATIRAGAVSDPALDLQADCAGLGITDLTGIEHVTGLASLDLDDNAIIDVAPLGALGRNLAEAGSSLDRISLDDNRVANLGALKDLVVQHSFSADDQRVTLPSVDRLVVLDNPITNRDGTVIVPTSDDPGFAYNAELNRFKFVTSGTKTIAWSAPVTPGTRDDDASASGTLTITVGTENGAGNGGGNSGGNSGGTSGDGSPAAPAAPAVVGAPAPAPAAAAAPAVAPPAASATGGTLAETGPEVSVPALVAACAVALGVGALAIGRSRGDRRPQRPTSAA
ncbi:hypothetical protein ACL9RL_00940 [Plantibacter sp. Mn2098]|uniref:hypothetical protein n=1 Tax=Plantibacter sp. Mn2098 TaxID=3395266 RepID=UPI003BED10E9